MRIFILDFKQAAKARLTWITGIVALLLTAAVAVSMLMSETYQYADSNGNTVQINGLSAAPKQKEKIKPFEGDLTIQSLQSHLAVYQALGKRYGNDMPGGIFYQEISPRWPILALVGTVYGGPSADSYRILETLTPAQCSDFYKKRTEVLTGMLAAQYPGNQDAQRQALAVNAKIRTPFSYYYGVSNRTVYAFALLVFLLALLCIVINSSVFSGGYQSGADDILRTTKHGRRKLALCKLCSSLLIDILLFSVCMFLFTLVINTGLGWDSLKTSTQMSAAFSILPLNIGQEELAVILGGFVSLVSVSCFTMFVSGKCRNATTSLILGIAFCVLPDLIFIIAQGSSGNPVALLGAFLPAGGLGMNNNLFNQMNALSFLQIGPWTAWIPFLMMGAALIEIPVFFLLAVHAYCRHQSA